MNVFEIEVYTYSFKISSNLKTFEVATFVKNRGLVCLHFVFTEILKIVAESG
jgi:hypothetical protein